MHFHGRSTVQNAKHLRKPNKRRTEQKFIKTIQFYEVIRGVDRHSKPSYFFFAFFWSSAIFQSIDFYQGNYQQLTFSSVKRSRFGVTTPYLDFAVTCLFIFILLLFYFW